jgi:hypothetical protein
MKTKIALAVLMTPFLITTAQIKVYSGGKVYVGGTSTTPSSVLSVGGAGSSSYEGFFYFPAIGGAAHTYGVVSKDTTGYSGGYGSYTYGLYGSAYKNVAVTYGVQYGVYGLAGNATSGCNYGTCGLIAGTNNGAGIYGAVTYDNALIPGKYAGYFDGKIRTTDNSPEKPSGGSWVGYSDARLKTGIIAFKDGINVLRLLNPVSYKFNGIGGLSTIETHIGLIAQDIQVIAPYCLGTGNLLVKQAEAGNFNVLENLPVDSTGVPKCIVSALTYSYDALIYVLINSVKQLDSTVIALQNQANGQKINSGSGQQSPTTYVELVNNDQVILYQNEPNPFESTTTIRYFIPENISASVYISFYDMYGKEIKRNEIKERGFGKVEAGTENLTVGIYSYNIMINNKIIDTKKMIRTK